MNPERLNELALAIVIAVIVAAGVVAGVVADPVRKPADEPSSEDLFLERSVYCSALPSNSEATSDGTLHQAAGPSDDQPVLIGTSSAGAEPAEVQGNIVVTDVREPVATDFTAFGGSAEAVTSGTFTGPVAGLGASRCSRDAGRHWYFPYGSSARGFNEWIVLYNPFPDEAVVRVTFLSEAGQRTKGALSDVAVPAGRVTSLRVNDYILQQRGLGAEVIALRGRVVAWQTVFEQAEEKPSGASITLGAPDLASDWYFPAGAIGKGLEERISIINPGDGEAIVTVSLVSDTKAIQPPDLVEMAIPRRTSREIDLSEVVKGEELGGVSVAVRSVNKVPIAAQRTVFYGQGAFKGFTSEMGAPQASTSWWVGPAAAKADNDSLILMNASQDEASVEVTLFPLEGQPISGGTLEGLTIPPGGRLRVPLQDLTGGRAAAAVVTSTVDVVAERIVYSSSAGDVATVMGTFLK